MSLQSAVAALSQDASNLEVVGTKSSASTSSQPQTTPNVPAKLEEALKPKIEDKPQIGADRFAALAKKERLLQKQMSEIKAREAKALEWEKVRSEASSNPLKALEVLGISYQQLTDFILNGQKATPDLELKAVKDEVAKFKQEQLDRDKKAQQQAKERAEREYNQTLTEFESEVADYLSENKDAYELTNMYEGRSIVLATIEQHFANTKKIMSIKEASDLVEQYFEEQVKRAQASNKFKGEQAQKKDGQPSREASAKTSAPTLNNGMTSSAPSLLPAKTENDRIQRALAALGK